MFRLLYPQEKVPVLIVQEAGGAPGLVQMGVEKRKSLAPIGVWNPNCPAHSKTLHQLCCVRYLITNSTMVGCRATSEMVCDQHKGSRVLKNQYTYCLGWAKYFLYLNSSDCFTTGILFWTFFNAWGMFDTHNNGGVDGTSIQHDSMIGLYYNRRWCIFFISISVVKLG